MKDITFDTTSLSEQLGLYDFFNVLVYGATFVSGVSLLSEKLCRFLWDNLSFQKGLGIVLLIYITGILMQELGATVDECRTKIYKSMTRRILTGQVEKTFKEGTSNDIIKNPVVLEKYRKNAKGLLEEFAIDTEDDKCFDDKYVNGYIFSICQYYVSVRSKDKKVEKLRALFSMSKTLMSCFFLLAICAVGTLIFNIDMSIDICSTFGFAIQECAQSVDKIIMMVMFVGIGVAFWARAKRTMRIFLLVLLGTYNALLNNGDCDETEERFL